MVAGSKAEDDLLGMTRKEMETEMLKMPAQKRFREFNTHLAKTPGVGYNEEAAASTSASAASSASTGRGSGAMCQRPSLRPLW
jgi:hypothetical protein